MEHRDMAEVEIKDMLDNMIASKGAEVQQNFNDLMQARTNDALDTLRQEKADDVFNKHVVDPNMEPQGVGLDDALVAIDQTTGRPVEGDTNE
jgi:hypothetical protein